MQGLKSPGPDGFQPIFFFYQKYWNNVSSTLFAFVTNCFNKFLIILIPKSDNPECVNHFRLITLCNVGDKIITKIIVDRLRPLLNKIVGLCQASFMPGC